MKKEKPVKAKKEKKNGSCLVSIIVIIVSIAVIVFVSSLPDPEKESEEQATGAESTVDLEIYYDSFQNQTRAVKALVSKHQNGEESPKESYERLNGIADGIQNSINAINGAEDSAYKDALVSYATGLKGVATHYAEYTKSGSQSELDDYNTLNESLESLWQEVENSKQ